MGIDFSKLNQRIQEEKERENRGNFGPKVLYWKPAQGQNRIRLCPPWTEEGHNSGLPFREIYRHWSIGESGYVEEGGTSFTCPVRTEDSPGGTCPICDLVSELRASGNPADQERSRRELGSDRRIRRRQFTHHSRFAVRP